ncbi:hypothetical protein X975_04190, partial [Stegodyphus mimosarum]
MMLVHPVLLGFLWSLLIQVSSGQSSSGESNKVYAYSYHIQHNGTTNSKEILRSVLGEDPDLGIEPPEGKSIVKTFSSPSIRGFFTKGVLPAGPVNRNYNRGFYNTNSVLDGIKKVVEDNLQPPSRSIATGLLPPISPDIAREFPGDFSANHLGNAFQNQDDFPKIPPPPPPVINNNNGISRVQTFSRNTPEGGRIVGQLETFSYNPPPVTNTNSRYQENSEGFRRKENVLNNNQEVTGHRTQTYFRQQFRTVTPNLDNSLHQNGIENRNIGHNNNNNNNQWWNVMSVLGNNNNNNNNGNTRNIANFNQQIDHNINQIRNNLNNQITREFGSRINAFNNRQNFQNNQPNNNIQQNFIPGNTGYRNPVQNINSQLPSIPFRNPQNNANTFFNSQRNRANGFTNQGINSYPQPLPVSNALSNHQNTQNFNNQRNFNAAGNQFLNDDTAKKVLNLINDVSTHLNNLNNQNDRQGVNNIGLTWDDDIIPNVNNDWSSRQPQSNGRPFSNAHSGPLPNPVEPKPVEALKTKIDALMAGRGFQVPSIPINDNQPGNYRNVNGGGVEKFFGFDRVIEGPNSFSRNQRSG